MYTKFLENLSSCAAISAFSKLKGYREENTHGKIKRFEFIQGTTQPKKTNFSLIIIPPLLLGDPLNKHTSVAPNPWKAMSASEFISFPLVWQSYRNYKVFFPLLLARLHHQGYYNALGSRFFIDILIIMHVPIHLVFQQAFTIVAKW